MRASRCSSADAAIVRNLAGCANRPTAGPRARHQRALGRGPPAQPCTPKGRTPISTP